MPQGHPDHDQLNARLDQLERTLGGKIDATRERVNVQNGRVGNLETIVTGHPDVGSDRGLVGAVDEHGEMVRLVRGAVKAAKWAAGTFGAAALALAGNLAAGAL